MKYDASFKLKVVAFANSSNNSVAATNYGVNEKMVRDWQKSEASLKKIPPKKCAVKIGICHWHELENYLEEDDLLWRDSDEEEDDSKNNEDEVGSSSDSDLYENLFMLGDEQPADFEGF
ncbi:Pogo transposable element-like 75, partial [Homarus americanus]